MDPSDDVHVADVDVEEVDVEVETEVIVDDDDDDVALVHDLEGDDDDAAAGEEREDMADAYGIVAMTGDDGDDYGDNNNADNDDAATTTTASAATANNNTTHEPTPSHVSSVHPLPISQVDKIIKQSLAEAAHVASMVGRGRAGGGGANNAAPADASSHSMTMSKDAKIAAHKATNVFVMMLAAMVEHNRREALVEAASEVHKARVGGGSSRKVTQTAQANLVAAQKKYKGIIGPKDIEAALEAAGYKHLVPMLNKKRGRD